MSIFLAIAGGLIGGIVIGIVFCGLFYDKRAQKQYMEEEKLTILKLKEELEAIKLKNQLMKEQIEKDNIERYKNGNY